MTTNSLYITAIFNLNILDNLGQGILIRGDIYLTNDKTFIRSLLSRHLYEAIGNLEFEALYNAEAIFYKISSDNISSKKA